MELLQILKKENERQNILIEGQNVLNERQNVQIGKLMQMPGDRHMGTEPGFVLKGKCLN